MLHMKMVHLVICMYGECVTLPSVVAAGNKMVPVHISDTSTVAACCEAKLQKHCFMQVMPFYSGSVV